MAHSNLPTSLLMQMYQIARLQGLQRPKSFFARHWHIKDRGVKPPAISRIRRLQWQIDCLVSRSKHLYPIGGYALHPVHEWDYSPVFRPERCPLLLFRTQLHSRGHKDGLFIDYVGFFALVQYCLFQWRRAFLCSSFRETGGCFCPGSAA